MSVPAAIFIFAIASTLIGCGRTRSPAIATPTSGQGAEDFGVVTNVSRFGSMPCWAPDSRRITFSNTNSPGIWIYDRDTGTTRQIHAPGNFPAWSPAGDRIAFYKEDQLWTIKPDGTDAFNTGLRAGAHIQWSPDGHWILTAGSRFCPHDGLLLVDVASWTQTELAFARAGERQQVGDFTWTPDGNILLTLPCECVSGWPPNEIREFSLDGQLIRQTLLYGFDRRPFGVRVSPDNKFLLFDRGSRGLWIANRDGSHATRLSAIGAASEWARNQRSLVFDDSSSTPNVRNGIFILDLSLPLKLTPE